MKSTHYKTCNFIMKLDAIFVKITIQSLDITIGIAQLINWLSLVMKNKSCKNKCSLELYCAFSDQPTLKTDQRPDVKMFYLIFVIKLANKIQVQVHGIRKRLI